MWLFPGDPGGQKYVIILLSNEISQEFPFASTQHIVLSCAALFSLLELPPGLGECWQLPPDNKPQELRGSEKLLSGNYLQGLEDEMKNILGPSSPQHWRSLRHLRFGDDGLAGFISSGFFANGSQKRYFSILSWVSFFILFNSSLTFLFRFFPLNWLDEALSQIQHITLWHSHWPFVCTLGMRNYFLLLLPCWTQGHCILFVVLSRWDHSSIWPLFWGYCIIKCQPLWGGRIWHNNVWPREDRPSLAPSKVVGLYQVCWIHTTLNISFSLPTRNNLQLDILLWTRHNDSTISNNLWLQT